MSDICETCSRAVPVWFAPNELWNEVMGSERQSIVCPVCFIERAEHQGVIPSAWKLDVEKITP